MTLRDDRRFVHRPLGEPPPTLRPVIGWLARESVGGATRYEPHLHTHFELIVAERGTYRCRLAGDEVRLRPGEALLAVPGDAHEDPLSAPVRYLACNFTVEPSADPGRSPSPLLPDAAPGLRLLGRGGPALAELVARIRAALATPPDAYGWAALDASCAAFLWEAVRALPPTAVAPAFRLHAAAIDAMTRTRAAFAACLHRTTPVSELAARAGLPPRAFAAACHHHLGMPPLAAFRRARCEAAAALLAQGEPVAAVAARLGFANPFHFSRTFRRAMGGPPSRWQG